MCPHTGKLTGPFHIWSQTLYATTQVLHWCSSAHTTAPSVCKNKKVLGSLYAFFLVIFVKAAFFQISASLFFPFILFHSNSRLTQTSGSSNALFCNSSYFYSFNTGPVQW